MKENINYLSFSKSGAFDDINRKSNLTKDLNDDSIKSESFDDSNFFTVSPNVLYNTDNEKKSNEENDIKNDNKIDESNKIQENSIDISNSVKSSNSNNRTTIKWDYSKEMECNYIVIKKGEKKCVITSPATGLSSFGFTLNIYENNKLIYDKLCNMKEAIGVIIENFCEGSKNAIEKAIIKLKSYLKDLSMFGDLNPYELKELKDKIDLKQKKQEKVEPKKSNIKPQNKEEKKPDLLTEQFNKDYDDFKGKEDHTAGNFKDAVKEKDCDMVIGNELLSRESENNINNIKDEVETTDDQEEQLAKLIGRKAREIYILMRHVSDESFSDSTKYKNVMTSYKNFLDNIKDPNKNRVDIEGLKYNCKAYIGFRKPGNDGKRNAKLYVCQQIIKLLDTIKTKKDCFAKRNRENNNGQQEDEYGKFAKAKKYAENDIEDTDSGGYKGATSLVYKVNYIKNSMDKVIKKEEYANEDILDVFYRRGMKTKYIKHPSDRGHLAHNGERWCALINNVLTYCIAKKLGMEDLIPKSRMVKITGDNGSYGALMMEDAGGVAMNDVKHAVGSGLGGCNSYIMTKDALARVYELGILDTICYQRDRHENNIMFDYYESEDGNVITGVKGIDNDEAFLFNDLNDKEKKDSKALNQVYYNDPDKKEDFDFTHVRGFPVHESEQKKKYRAEERGYFRCPGLTQMIPKDKKEKKGKKEQEEQVQCPFIRSSVRKQILDFNVNDLDNLKVLVGDLARKFIKRDPDKFAADYDKKIEDVKKRIQKIKRFIKNNPDKVAGFDKEKEKNDPVRLNLDMFEKKDGYYTNDCVRGYMKTIG